MKIIFMGTPDIAVPVLESLTDGGHQVIAAITQPDKPRGRGKAVQMTPVKEKALELHIPVYQPAKVREPEFVAFLEEMKPDAIVVIAFGQIIPKSILDIPKYGCINIHASLLPKYRGAAPIQWAVIDGEKESGVTTMMMDEGLDTGDMLETEIIPLEEKETGGSLFDKISLAGGRLILSTLEKLEKGTCPRTPQPEEGACYAKKLTKEMGNIDWSMDAEAIERLIRGLNPWPSAYTGFQGKTVKIWEADAKDKDFDGEPGEIVFADKSQVWVKTGKGSLSIRRLQLEGKKQMDIDAFLRGCEMKSGMKFERGN